MKRLLLLSLISVVLFFGCTRNVADTRDAELKVVIAKYNNALVEAYKNQNPAPLREVVGDNEVRKIGTIVESFLQSDEIMEAELVKINFKEIKIDAAKAEVRTSEDWRYRWVHIKTGKETEPVEDIHYDMLYNMAKKDGKWLIEKTEDESHKTTASPSSGH